MIGIRKSVWSPDPISRQDPEICISFPGMDPMAFDDPQEICLQFCGGRKSLLDERPLSFLFHHEGRVMFDPPLLYLMEQRLRQLMVGRILETVHKTEFIHFILFADRKIGFHQVEVPPFPEMKLLNAVRDLKTQVRPE